MIRWKSLAKPGGGSSAKRRRFGTRAWIASGSMDTKARLDRLFGSIRLERRDDAGCRFRIREHRYCRLYRYDQSNGDRVFIGRPTPTPH
jgi:hypothetical protein